MTQDASGGGGSPDGGTPDAGPPDAGPPDAGPPDAGPPDAGPPTVIFSDSFNRTTGLGSNWRVTSGSWVTSTTTPRAESGLDGFDQAVVQNLSCADCSVSARLLIFSVGV